MSRFTDCDNDSENWALDMGRWEHNARVALKGRRGRKALAELREALMALPEHRLIEGALCTVGADQRRAALAAEAIKLNAQHPGWHFPQLDEAADLARHVERNGEGVCAIGAYLWYRKVKAGINPAEAFASLPTVHGSEDGNGLDWTARLGEADGLTFTLAWELAYRNDERLRDCTAEERHARFVRWIDSELSEPASAMTTPPGAP